MTRAVIKKIENSNFIDGEAALWTQGASRMVDVDSFREKRARPADLLVILV